MFLGIDNVQIIDASATRIPLEDDSIDLVTSNLGINNFEDKTEVYTEINRVLKKDGSLCITTNPMGTFNELFQIMMQVCDSMNLDKAHASLKDYVNNRSTKEQIIEEFGNHSFELVNKQETVTKMRFVDAKAVFNHSLIRIGFRAYWEQMIQETNSEDFFEAVIKEIGKVIAINAVFEMTVPILYLEFRKGKV